MVIGVVLFIIAILCTVLGTKEQEAIALYYDAQDVRADGTVAATAADAPAPSPGMTVNVGGQQLRARAQQVQPSADADDMRAAAEAEDPVDTDGAAEDLFTKLRRNGL